MATTKFEKPVGSETFQLQQQVSTMNTSLNVLTTKVGNVGSTDLQTQVNTLNSNIQTVEYAIPNDTDSHNYDLPTGMNTAIFIGAKCFTKYDSWVDISYANGEYFGGIGFMAGNGKFKYSAKVAGNSTRVLFAFLKVT